MAGFDITEYPGISITNTPAIERARALYPRTYFLPKPVHLDKLDELLRIISASERLHHVERN